MTTAAQIDTAPAWTDADVLAILQTHERALRLEAGGVDAESVVACWRGLLDALACAVEAGAVRRLPDIRRCLIALARPAYPWATLDFLAALERDQRRSAAEKDQEPCRRAPGWPHRNEPDNGTAHHHDARAAPRAGHREAGPKGVSMIAHRKTMARRTAAGGSGTTAGIVGRLHIDTTEQATTGTAEEVLATYTVDPDTLNRDGRTIRVTVHGVTAANANTKLMRLRWGGLTGDVVTSTTVSAGVSAAITLTGEIIRTAANAQSIGGVGIMGTIVGHIPPTASAKTDTGAIDIVVTATTGTAAGDITFKSLIVEMLN